MVHIWASLRPTIERPTFSDDDRGDFSSKDTHAFHVPFPTYPASCISPKAPSSRLAGLSCAGRTMCAGFSCWIRHGSFWAPYHEECVSLDTRQHHTFRMTCRENWGSSWGRALLRDLRPLYLPSSRVSLPFFFHGNDGEVGGHPVLRMPSET